MAFVAPMDIIKALPRVYTVYLFFSETASIFIVILIFAAVNVRKIPVDW
jgi:hypothetical protein